MPKTAHRNRLTVALGDGWQFYSPVIPAGSRALGIVSRGVGDTGALIVTPAGLYAQANAGALRNLPQAAVVRALAAATAAKT